MDEMQSFFERAKNAVPNMCFGTDLMVGFPGETDSDFQETCESFLSMPFAYCHVFTFSERTGTPAAKMNEVVPVETRRRRSAQLRRLSSSKRMEFHEKQIGKTWRVLLENPKEEFYSGYTDHYVRVMVPMESVGLENRMASVKMLRASPEFMEGEIVSLES